MSEYKLVPVEPTEKMWKASNKYLDVVFNSFSHAYKAMLSASPKIEIGQGLIIQSIQADTITIDRAEYEAMKADAERYRWLKDNGRANSKNAGNAVYPKFGLKAIFSFHYWTDDLDQAIDQARFNNEG